MSGRVAQHLRTVIRADGTKELVMSDEGFLQGYSGFVDVTLADESVVQCKVLPIERTAFYMKLYQEAEQGDSKAMLIIADEFPKEVGLEGQALTLGELFDVLRGFFSARRPKRPTSIERATIPVEATD